MTVKLLTEHHLEFLSLKGGCKGLSESIHVKMPHSWIFVVVTQLYRPRETHINNDIINVIILKYLAPRLLNFSHARLN